MDKKRRLEAKRDVLAPSIPSLSKWEEFHAVWKAVVPLMLEFGDFSPKNDLTALFARMYELWPLSADTWRRRGLVAGFVATHRKRLTSGESGVLDNALLHFTRGRASSGAGGGGVEDGNFHNAIEAFAQGRSYNQHTVSTPTLNEVIGELQLYESLQYDPKWRKELLDVERAMEASKVLSPKEPKLFFYWALFHFWTASALAQDKKPSQAKMFFVAAFDRCMEALALKPAYAGPLLLASECLSSLLDKDVAPGGVVVRPFIKRFLAAFETSAKLHPYGTSFSPISSLLAVSSADGGDREGVMAMLYDMSVAGANRQLRLQAVQLLLQADQKTPFGALQPVYKSVDITNRDAVAHLEAFLALMTYHPRGVSALSNNEGGHLQVGRDKAKESGAGASPRTLKKLFKLKPTTTTTAAAAAPKKGAAVNARIKEAEAPARRKASIWVPDPSIRFEDEIRQGDPKKLYTFLGELGTGGFAHVVRARRKSDSLNVAIKVIDKPVSKAGQQILAEVQVMRMCHEAHIVDLLDALYWKDQCYLVMRYCDGGSLDKLIELVQFNDAQKAHVFVRVCRALAYLETLSLVHRDVKPANILLSKSGHIRLGDLGLMKPQVVSRYGRSTAGTPHYRAPELLLGFGATCKSDVYSFGCALYTIEFRRAPYAGLNPSKLLWEVTTTDGIPRHSRSREKLPHASDLMTNLMQRCFVLDPEKRAAASELIFDPFFALDSREATESITHLCSISFLDDALEQVGFTM